MFFFRKTTKKEIFYKTDDEVESIRTSCLMVCDTLSEVAKVLKPGITGNTINKIAEEYILDNKAVPSFKNYNGFPAGLCVSVNEQVVHGFPSDYEFKDGDIVSVDCGVYFNDFHGDAAYTFAIGNINPDTMRLLRVTKESLYKGIASATEGKRMGDVAFSIEDHCRKHHFGVVKELTGHGIGRNLHEEPEVPNYGKRGSGIVLRSGLVIAIEPMITLGKRDIATLSDNWTIVTRDRKPAAHYEHTIVVRKQKADILSNHTKIEEAIKNNSELSEIL
jgi:methionyl aminopeptidase